MKDAPITNLSRLVKFVLTFVINEDSCSILACSESLYFRANKSVSGLVHDSGGV